MLTRRHQFAPRFAVFLLSCSIGSSAMAGERQDARLLTSTQVLGEVMQVTGIRRTGA